MCSQNLCEEADTDFVFAHQVEQTQTRVISKRPEEAIHVERLVLHHTAEILSQSIYVLTYILKQHTLCAYAYAYILEHRGGPGQ
jgi:hypothetical protein